MLPPKINWLHLWMHTLLHESLHCLHDSHDGIVLKDSVACYVYSIEDQTMQYGLLYALTASLNTLCASLK